MSKLFSSASGWLFQLFLSALTYSILFYCNSALAGSLTFGIGVNWLYLPAGLRIFLTLIFGLSGATGIAFASFLISYFGEFQQDLTLCIGIGLISGFAPYLARFLVLKNIELESDLHNLNIYKLGICILAYAFLSASLHQWWFYTMGLEKTGTLNHFAVMVFGDVLGSLLFIAVVKSGIDLLKRFKQTAR
jgi:hypothetical protein